MNNQPSAQARTESSLIDLNLLNKMLKSDPVKVKKFAHKFVLSAEEGLAEIEEALKQESWEQLAALGHRNKSPAKTVGATEYAAFCQALEQFKSGGDVGEVKQIVASMRLMLQQMSELINKQFP